MLDMTLNSGFSRVGGFASGFLLEGFYEDTKRPPEAALWEFNSPQIAGTDM